MECRIASLMLLGSILVSAADFQDFQAARAVIGQPSFSARDKGVTANALSLAKGSLFVADASGRLLTFDLSRIGSAPTPGCPVCLTVPLSSTAQNVFEGVAAFAVNGQKIAIADPKSHRVLLWNGGSSIELAGFQNPSAVALDSQRLFVADAAVHHVFIWNRFPALSTQPPDVTLGVSDGSDTAGADTLQTPVAMVSDGANLFVADGAAHRVLLFSAADSATPQILNAASLSAGPLAPGTLLSVTGSNENILLNGMPLRVTDQNGDQLQVQIPYELNNALSGSVWVETGTENGSISASRPVSVRFIAASPGIFAFGLKEPRTGLILHAPDGVPVSPEDPAKPLELLTVWATGLGAVALDKNAEGGFAVLTPVRAIVNGIAAEVVSAMLPVDSTGVYEVRLRLPTEITSSASLQLIQSDSRSNAVTFPVKSN